MKDLIPGTHEKGFVEQTITQRRVPLGLPTDPRVRSLKYFTMGECSILLAREQAGIDGEWLWHLSISHKERHPSWDEIKTARYRLLDKDKCFGMLLPPPQYYVNIETQDHVFHLWEITDPREPWSAM